MLRLYLVGEEVLHLFLPLQPSLASHCNTQGGHVLRVQARAEQCYHLDAKDFMGTFLIINVP